MDQEDSYEDWIKLIHNHAIEKYSEITQELIRNVSMTRKQLLDNNANAITIKQLCLRYHYQHIIRV